MFNELIRNIFRPTFSSMFGDDEPSPSFSLDNQGGLTAYGRGDVTPTFTRATSATTIDHEGLIKPVGAGEYREVGSRRVENLLTASEDMTNGVYADDNGAVSTATQTTFDATANGGVNQSVTITDDSSGVGGRTFAYSVFVKLVSGTIAADGNVTLRITGNAVTATSVDIGTELTGSSQRFSLTASTDAAGTTVIPEVECDIAAVLEITKWQLEEVTGQTNQNPSEYVSSGVLSAPYHGANVDSVKLFTTHNGNTVSAGVVTEATGPQIGVAGQYADFNDVLGDRISTPDSAASSITSDITIIGHASCDDWTPAEAKVLIQKWVAAGNQRSYALILQADGTMQLSVTTDGSTAIATPSTVANGFANGTAHWIRITLDVVNDTVNFYTSDQSIGTAQADLSWTQLGTADQTQTVTAIYDGTAPTEVGGYSNAAEWQGQISRALVIASTDPTVAPAVDYNASEWTAGLTHTSNTGEVWTINGSVTMFAPLSRWIDVDGSSDGWTSPDSAAASITSDASFIGYGAPDSWTAGGVICAKTENTGSQASYTMQAHSTGLRLITSVDGSATVASNSTDAIPFAAGCGGWIRITWDDSANTTNFYTSSDSPWTPYSQISWTQLGDADVAHVSAGIFDSTALVTVGGQEDGLQTAEWVGRIMRACAIASTDPTAVPAWDFDVREYLSGSTFTSNTGEVWTAVGNGTVEGMDYVPSMWDADGPYGYWPETARTNICLQSEDLSTTWTNVRSVDTQNTTVAPDGKSTANTITDDSLTGSSSCYMNQALTVSSGTSTFSAYCKADQLDWVALENANYDAGGSDVSFFDLTNGVVGTKGSNHSSSGIESVGNGWYRCWITFTTTGDLAGQMIIYVAEADLDNSVTRDGTSSIHAWGAQVELGSFPSAYIPTTVASVTRNKDELTYPAASNAPYPMTGFITYTPKQITAIGVLLDINDGTADERVELSVDATGKPRLLVRASAGDVADITAASALVAGTTYTIAYVVDVNDARLYVDGAVTGTPDTGLALPATASAISVGQDYNAANQNNGNENSLLIYSKPLSATEIARLSA